MSRHFAAVLVLLLFAAPPAAAQEPLRIGFLTILTGALAAPGKERIKISLGNDGEGLRPVTQRGRMP